MGRDITTVSVSKSTLRKIQSVKYRLKLRNAEEVILLGLKLIEERIKKR